MNENTITVAHMYPSMHAAHRKHLDEAASLSYYTDVALVPVDGDISDATLTALWRHPAVDEVLILPEEEYEKSTQMIRDKKYKIICIGIEGLENTWEKVFWEGFL